MPAGASASDRPAESSTALSRLRRHAGSFGAAPEDAQVREQVAQGLRRHGLHQVTVEAGGLRTAYVLILTVARQGHKDDPFPTGTIPDACGDLVAVDPREADVQEDQVIGVLGDGLDRREA